MFRTLALVLIACAYFGASARAWWTDGHIILSKASVLALPSEVPAFFRKGGGAIAHYSVDPDLAKIKGAPTARFREEAKHFLDYEKLKGLKLPAKCEDYLTALRQRNLSLEDVGEVPYAVADWTDRLTVAFAEHRRWPKNRSIQEKILLYAGYLSHYATDLAQPLHTTMHHDGKLGADGSNPRTGIHDSVDGIIEALRLDPARIARQVRGLEASPDFMPAVLEQFAASHGLVESVYGMEAKFLGRKQEPGGAPDPALVEFVNDRAHAASALTAKLFLTAWRNSKSIQLPRWLKSHE